MLSTETDIDDSVVNALFPWEHPALSFRMINY